MAKIQSNDRFGINEDDKTDTRIEAWVAQITPDL